MANAHGRFCWYELMTSDQDAAAAFYRKVVGWNEQAMGSAEAPYTVLLAGDRGVGGILPVPPHAAGTPPHWIGYILVDDVDAAAAKIVSAGGAVHRAAWDIPGVGRLAVVADPHGAAFVVFKNAPQEVEPSEVAPGTVGHVGWRELMAGEVATAFDFYAAQFGWTKTAAHDMGPMGLYQLFNDGSAEGDAGGMMTKPAQMPVSGWNYYFTVDSVSAAVERLKAGGGTVVNGPMQVPGDAWVVQAVDPQGAMFALTSGVA